MLYDSRKSRNRLLLLMMMIVWNIHIIVTMGYLGEGHLGDDGQHDLLSFCRVRILFMFIEPSFESGGGFSGRIFPSGCQVSISPVTKQSVINCIAH